jgi:GNAT superfamily N-acetyltransferase
MREPTLIRPATLDDVPALVSLLETLGYPADRDRLAATLGPLLADGRSAVVVAADAAGAVVGLLALSARPALRLQGWVGAIEELVVRDDVRGRGLGRRLLQYAKGLAASRGWVRLELTVTRARQVHRRGLLAAARLAPIDVVTYRWTLLEGRHPVLPALPVPGRQREFA